MTQTPLITTRFDASSTAEEVVAGLDLRGLRAVVTGATSGIGTETARVLALAGADVTLAVRDTGAGQRAADGIAAATGNHGVGVAALDLADRGSVTRFARGWDGPLHLLVNNAGLVTAGLERTAEGWELQFAVNYLVTSRWPGRCTTPWPRGPGSGARPGSPRSAPPPTTGPGRLRRPLLRTPALRPADRLRPVEDGGLAVRGGGDQAVGP